MARIRVDTEDLRSKAKDFESAAESIAKVGDDILAAAMSLPSYDGQLSGPARAAGYEIQQQSRELQTNLAADAQSLTNTAQAFEQVDKETINAFTENQASIRETNLVVNTKGFTGTGDFGYEETSISITIWCCGESTIIAKGSDNYERYLDEIQLYKDNVDKYWDMVSKSGYPWAIWQKVQDTCSHAYNLAECVNDLFDFGSSIGTGEIDDASLTLIMMLLNENWNWTMINLLLSFATGGAEGTLPIFIGAIQLKDATCGLFKKIKTVDSPFIG